MDPEARTWDAAIIGSGIGGSAAAWMLARSGLSVIVIERGHDHRSNPKAVRGHMLADLPPGADGTPLGQGGRETDLLTLDDGSRTWRHRPFLGMGTGGSSAIYGTALERFSPEDFTPRRLHPQITESALPEAWPFAWEEMVPWYEVAESRFGVVGGEPLDPGRLGDLTPANAQLARHLLARGLPLRRLSIGDRGDGSRGTTQGMLCPHQRKRDAANSFLYPAIDEHGAVLLDEAQVAGLEGDGRNVCQAAVLRHGRLLRIKAGQFMLAGGALRTPAILLQSGVGGAAGGLANSSGWVGRGLMRHVIDLYAIRVDAGRTSYGCKEIACPELRDEQGLRLGSLQSFGALPPAGDLVSAMRCNAQEEGRWAVDGLLRLGAPAIRLLLGRLLARRAVLATIGEDLPYYDNRVSWAAQQGVTVHSRMQPELAGRVAALRRRMEDVLKGCSVMPIHAAEDLRRLAHACGTCRAGNDPATSVVDRWCRSHDVGNLHVVDASWIPSSGVTNPGLTIAANALRVASHLAQGSRAANVDGPGIVAA